MFRRISALIALAGALVSTNAFACTTAEGCINEVLYDFGGEPNDYPREYVELRATSGLTFPAGTYLVQVEGDATGPRSRGLVTMVFDLSGKTVGSNGHMVLLMSGHPYTVTTGATSFVGTTTGFAGLPGATGRDEIDEGSLSVLLIRSAAAPVAATTDIDANNDGVGDGAYLTWTRLDSIGVLDGNNAADRTYADLTLSGDEPAYVGRAGDSTGNTAGDWVLALGAAATTPPFLVDTTPPLSFFDYFLTHIGGSNFGNSFNNAPVNTVPGNQSTPEDTTLVFSTANGNALSVNDADAGTTTIQIDVTVTNGSFSLVATAGVTITGNGTAAVRATGSQANLRLALAGSSYAPTPNYSGPATLNLTTNDLGNSGNGGARTDSDNVAINVTVVDDLPGAVTDTNNAVEGGGAVTGNVTTNDTLGDTPTAVNAASQGGNAITLGTPFTTAGGGSLTLAASGAYTYTPPPIGAVPQAGLVETFAYTIRDTDGDASSSTLTITVANVDQTPNAVDDAYATNEDVPLALAAPGVRANDTNPDGGTVLTVTAGPTNGTLTVALANDGSFTYTPNANFFGSDAFTYRLCDGDTPTPDCDTATVTITIASVDETPTAGNDTFNGTEELPLVVAAPGVRANDTNPDGGTVLIVTAGPTNGALTSALANDGSFTYTPNANFFGDDTFTYQICDGDAPTPDCATATVTLAIAGVNDNPAATDDTATVAEDSSANAIAVLDNDTDGVDSGETLTVTAVTQGTNGTAAFTPTGVSYTPNADFFGTDAFTYTISDGNGGSATATVNVTVTNVNDNPVATDDAAMVAEDSTANAIDVLGNDTDGVDSGETLTVTAVTQGTNGATVAFTAGGVTYTPAANFQGTDTFTYTISDGNGGSATATVTVTVTNANDAPVAVADSYSTDEDLALTVPAATGVLANDTDLDPTETLTAMLVTDVASGTLALAPDGGFLYTPAANFSGSDSFTYQANDGDVDSNTVTVSLAVTSVNDNPVATDDTATVAEDSSANAIAVLDNDTDGVDSGETLTVTAVTQGTNGTAAFTPTGVSYTPNADFFGTDAFTYTISDGNGGSATATVNVTVTNVNDNPVATDDAAMVAEDSTANAIDVLGNDTDGVDSGETLTVTAVTQGTNGATVAFTAGGVTYTPAANFQGTDTFTYTISDGNGGSATATVTVTVTNTNDAPVAVADSYSTDEDLALTVPAATGVLANDTDLDPTETLTAMLVTDVASGTLALAPDGGFLYTPAANFSGSDSFTYQANDGDVDSNTVTVSLAVTSVNDNPVATDDTATVAEDSSANAIAVLDNDTDGVDSGETLTVTAVTQGTNGTAAFTPTGVSYTPNADFFGTDAFTYTISDGNGGSATATVNVTVTNVNDNPVATDDAAMVAEDSTANAIDVLGNDTDGVDSGETLTVTAVTQGTNGATVAFTAGGVTYTPAANFQGTDTFTYTISDGNGGSATATVTVTVTNANDAPVVDDQSFTVAENAANGTVVGTVAATDVDLDTLSYAVTGTAFAINASTGQITVADAAALDFETTPSFSLTATVTDSASAADSATITINVTNGNEGPTVTSAGTASVSENATAVQTVTATDPDAGATLTFAITGGADAALFTLNAASGALAFATAPDFEAPDDAGANNVYDVTVSASDGTLSDDQTVAVTVTDANEGPTPTFNNSATVAENTTVVYTVTATDPDVTANLSFSIPGGADASKFTIDPGTKTLSFLAAPDFDAPTDANADNAYELEISVTDGTLSASRAVVVTVADVNEVPVFTVGADQTRAEDTGAATVIGWATGIDDGDAATQALAFNVTGNTNPALFAAGPSVAANGDLTYTLAANANGTATITLALSDDGASTPPNVDTSAPQTFAITVTSINDAPAANDGSLAVTEDVSANGTLAGSDVEGDAITFAIATQGTKGVATVTNAATGAYTYVPNDDATGSDAFTFVANDGALDSAPATISVTIAALDDDVLDAIDDAATATEGGAVVTGNLLANDLSGDVPATVTAATQGANPLVIGAPYTTAGNGTLTLQSNGAFSYTPPAQGQVPPAGIVEAFVYTLSDVDGDTATASLTITVGDNDVDFPSVVSIARMDANPAVASPVRFRITFTETVNGVGGDDLRLVTTGDVSGHTIDAVSCANAICTVTVSILGGDGTLGLNLADDDSIVDLAGFALGGTGAGNGNFTGEVYDVDLGEPGPTSFPFVNSITRLDPNPNPGPSVRFAIRFTEAVTGVDASDFASTKTGNLTGGTIGAVTGSGQDWIVTVDTGTGAGKLGLDLVDNNSIRDVNDDPLGGGTLGDGSFLTGDEYDIDTVNGIGIFKDGFENPVP